MNLINKLLIHPVDFDCNMSCGYCYNGSYGNQVVISQSVIPEKLLCKLFSEIINVCSGNKIVVIWHGGEPLLAGKEFYRRAIEIQKQIGGGKYVFRNCVQTNGTLIDNEWVDLFRELNIEPSVSIDGCARLHNQVRTFLDGSPTYDKAIVAYNMMRNKGLRTGLLMVISKINVNEPETIWQWILDQKIKSLDFLPCLEPEQYRAGKPLYTVSEEEIVKFSIKMFDLWFDYADPSIKIRTFRDGIKGQLGGKVNICSWKGGCLNHISVDPMGNIFPCGRYHCFPETNFGNLNDFSISEILEGLKTRCIHQAISDGQKECVGCRWYSICHSGCPFLKYAINGHWGGHFVHCHSRQKLFAHIRKRITT